MNNNLFFSLFLLSINYNCAEVKSQDFAQNIKSVDSGYVGQTHFRDDMLREDSLYTAIIRIDKQSNKEHLLSIQMNLKKNAYFVSPTESGAFTGKFTIVLTEPQYIQSIGSIIETPLSKVDEKEGFVKLVRENTHYKQSLKVLSKENFEVYGYIQFTIEPRCSLEKIPFMLSYVDGKLSVKLDDC
jgi:hypothetical protein